MTDSHSWGVPWHSPVPACYSTKHPPNGREKNCGKEAKTHTTKTHHHLPSPGCDVATIVIVTRQGRKRGGRGSIHAEVKWARHGVSRRPSPFDHDILCRHARARKKKTRRATPGKRGGKVITRRRVAIRMEAIPKTCTWGATARVFTGCNTRSASALIRVRP